MRTITPSTLQSYETHLQSEEKSPNTIAKYLRDLRTFSAWLTAHENPDITKETVIQYKQHLEQNYKPSSTNSMLVAINRFFRYIGWDDCVVKTIKTQPSHIYAQEKQLTRDDYQKLIDTAKKEGKDRKIYLVHKLKEKLLLYGKKNNMSSVCRRFVTELHSHNNASKLRVCSTLKTGKRR